jgi:AcrR family transcriptional regulator
MPMPTLAERLADHTERLILDAAVALLEHGDTPTLTVRAVAAAANLSERTVFRYFATRDDMLEAVAAEVGQRLDTPPVPAAIEELPAYPRALFTRLEAASQLTLAALHSEIFPRMRSAAAQQRWRDVRALLDAHAPGRPARERELTAANIRFFLAATTWQYYRFVFGFDLEDTIAAAELAIGQAIAALRVPIAQRPRGRSASSGVSRGDGAGG